MSHWFYDDDSERHMACWPSRDPEGDARNLRELLATCPEVYDISRMSDAEVRRQVGRYRAEGRLPTEREVTSERHAQRDWTLRWLRRDAQQSTPKEPLAAATTAARSPVTEEKRYTLIAALGYPRPSVEKNRISAVRCKLENAFTGPESRRSGAIQSSDAAFNAVRRRELRAGSYTLVLTRTPLTAHKLKALRAKP